MIGALLLLGLASAADVPSASLALQSALEAELARVRAANAKLEAGLPLVAPAPSLAAHPELPLQLPPSRPLVVYTSRGA